MTQQFDPDREIRQDELPSGSIIIHQDAKDPEHPMEKTAFILGRPVEVKR